MRYLSIAALLLALAAPAAAQSTIFDIVVLDDNRRNLAGLMFFDDIILDTANPVLSLRPRDASRIVDFGQPAIPWNTVNARSYSVDGQAGLTINVPLGNSCLLHFQGGLLVAVTGGFFGSCGQ